MSDKKKTPVKSVVRSRFNTVRQTQIFEGDAAISKAQQQFAKETDINVITEKYLTGKTPGIGQPRNNRQPIFGDFRSNDFQAMQNHLADIEGEFSTLPPKVRRRFKNDPFQLLRFVEDEANREEAIKLGLLPEPPPKSEFVDEFEPEGEARKKAPKPQNSPPKEPKKPASDGD